MNKKLFAFIVLLAIIFPVNFLKSPNFIALIGILFVCIASIRSKNYTIPVLMLLTLIPAQLNDDLVLSYNINRSFYYLILSFCLFLFCIKYRLKIRHRPLLIFIFIISFFYAFNNSREEIDYVLIFICYLYIGQILSENEDMGIKEFLNFVDIIFFIVAIYGIMEFIFRTSPYQDLYRYEWIGDMRIKGLLGHPLMLSGFMSIYILYLYTRILLLKQIPTIQIIIAIVLVLLTASRTCYLLIVLSFIIFLFYSNMSAFKRIGSIILICVLLIIVNSYLNEYTTQSFERISESSNSITNRWAAIDVAIDVFLNNLFGVGATGFSNEIKSGYNISSNFEIKVLDNNYLYFLVSYGLFSIPFIWYLINPIVTIKKNVTSRNHKCLVIIISTIWFLLPFSFIISIYPHILFMFSCLIGKIKKELDNGYISNTCKL